MGIVDAIQSGFLRTHQAIYEATRGFIGHRMIGVPTLLLTTTGRRTGERRTAALVYAEDDDGSLVVTASNGGADRAPAWLHNLRPDPVVDVQIGRRRFRATGEIIGPGHADHPGLWELVNENNHGRYDRYQQKTDRPIELVRLRRA